jgi:cob(I)alamin adenosyltransferase
MKIYTRTGDDGTTGLFSGGRVSKTHPRVDAYGAVDELNSVLGAARASSPQPEIGKLLEHVQGQLFKLGADLATAGDEKGAMRIGSEDVAWLESMIDEMSARLPALMHFILPGGTPAAAQIHVARAISRRGEREAWRVEDVRQEARVYLNRLSDFLFVLARFENSLSKVGEMEWRPASLEMKTPRG